MMNNPFLKRLIKEKSQDLMHSSAYGEAQNAGKIGAASTQSFEVRRMIDQGRTKVRGYNDSRVVNEEGNKTIRAAEYNAEKDAAQRAAIRDRIGGRREDASREKGSTADGVGGGSRFDAIRPAAGSPPTRRNPGISR